MAIELGADGLHSNNSLDPGTEALGIGCGWGGLSILLAKHFRACVTKCAIDVAVKLILSLHCKIKKG